MLELALMAVGKLFRFDQVSRTKRPNLLPKIVLQAREKVLKLESACEPVCPVGEVFELLDVRVKGRGMMDVGEPGVMVIMDVLIELFRKLITKVIPIREGAVSIVVSQPLHGLVVHVK